MRELFDLKKFDSYREDNRREVKKAEGAFLIVYGIPTLPLLIVMAV